MVKGTTMKWQWPWSTTEKRQDYTQELVTLLQQRASSGGDSTSVSNTAALEAAAGMVGRAFMSCEVTSTHGYSRTAITPDVLNHIGRALIRSGDCVLYIDVGDDIASLVPASEWEVSGSYERRKWTYDLELQSPNGGVGKFVPASQVLHFQYAYESSRPWRGIGPMQAASIAGTLNAAVNQHLADEASGPRGTLLPTPKAGDDPTLAGLVSQITDAKGRLLLVESMIAEWGAGMRIPAEWTGKRFGASPPDALVALRQHSDDTVYDACGLPPSLFVNSDGTGQRESWRRMLFGVLAPLGKMVELEMRTKIEDGIRLHWDELRASDLAGRARAFQGLVKAGMSISEAAGLAGLMQEE